LFDKISRFLNRFRTPGRRLIKGTVEYKKLGENRVLAIARVPGKARPIKTILLCCPPEDEDEDEEGES